MSDFAERNHARQYEAALRVAGRNGPAWVDLPEERREAIRAINRQHQQEMQELGEAISRGDVQTGLTVRQVPQ